MTKIVCVLIGIGLLFLTACGATLYPVTTGSYKVLPKQPARVVVWGQDDAQAVTSVALWLQKRGILIVERDKLQQALGGRPAVTRAGAMDEQALLQAVTLLGIDELVLVEASRVVTLSQTNRDVSRTDPATLHSTMVTIRGFNTRTGEVEWNASASFAPTRLENDDVFASLACQALATVWGFRPAGYHEVSSSDMCEVNPTNPYAPHSPPYQELGRKHSTDPVLAMTIRP